MMKHERTKTQRGPVLLARTGAELMLSCAAILSVSCSSGNEIVPRGERITHVQLEYGKPDVISDRSGSDERFYLPSLRPDSEWPAEAPRTFFYLDQNLAITFVLGKAVASGAIDPEVRTQVLEPLAQRHGGAK